MTSVVVLVSILVPLVFAALITLILVLLLTRSRPRPAPPAVVPGPDGRPLLQPSSWQAQVLGDGPLGRLGASLASTYGTVTVHAGRVSFLRDGAAEPDWMVGCAEVGVRRQGVGPFAVASVVLYGPMGEVAMNVSQERINRFSQNTLKTLRESGYADQFVASLLAHGARSV